MSSGPFKAFVAHESDLTGLLAYSLYKADKLSFLNSHPEVDPSGFMLGVRLPKQIQAYRERAEAMLERMSQSALDSAVEAAQKEQDLRFQAFERALGFWRSVWSNVAANLMSAAISVLGVVILFGNKLNFWRGVMRYFND